MTAFKVLSRAAITSILATDTPTTAADWRGAGSETLLAAWQGLTNTGQVQSLVVLTTAAYNALGSKNANTIYVISD